MKATIKTAKQTQEAIPEMGREAKTNYWIIIQVEGSEEKITVRTGEETYTKLTPVDNNKKTGGK